MSPPNDWEIKKCLCISLAVLLAMLGLVGLGALGFDIPGLRQIVGFIFLSFIPGILILKILKVHNIDAVESLLYSVGLSIAFIYFAGLFANFALPLIGISNPISILPTTTTVAIFTLILAGIAYKRDKDFSPSARDCFVEFPRVARDSPRNDREKSKFLSPPYLFLLVLPILAIFGAYLVNSHQNNILLLFFIPVICVVVALVAFDKLPKDAYPLAIVMIGLSLLLHVTLISSQLSGYDIHLEYYFQNLVVQNGYWDFTIPHTYNTALSVVMLCPIYSLVLNMDAIWTFKIIYPLIFCLVPLALFQAYREQIGEKKAFFATFFFMSMPMFVGMTTGVRNQIAQLFFALLILLMVDRRLTLPQKSVLATIFVICLPLSHYGLTYICIAIFGIGWLFLLLMKNPKVSYFWQRLSQRLSFSSANPGSSVLPPEVPRSSLLNGTLVSILIAFSLTWYIYITGGSAFHSIVGIGNHIYVNLGEFFNPMARESLVGTAIGLDWGTVSILGKAFRILQWLTQLFIVVGLAKLFVTPQDFRVKIEYIALSIVAGLILLACIVIPTFSAYLNVTRFYHISLFLLAPFCILGGEAIWQGASKLARAVSSKLRVKRGLALSTNPNGSNSACLRFLAVAILIPYFLFNAGFFFEVTGSERYGVNDSPSSMALSSYRFDMPVFNQKEAKAISYLAGRIDDDAPVYADKYGRLLLYDRLYGQVGIIPALGEVPKDSYIFLRTWNIERGEINVLVRTGVQGKHEHVKLSDIPGLFENRKLIYDNGSAQIWAPR